MLVFRTQCLRQARVRRQVLVFSHSVRMLRIIEKLVILKGYTFEYLDGETAQVGTLANTIMAAGSRSCTCRRVAANDGQDRPPPNSASPAYTEHNHGDPSRVQIHFIVCHSVISPALLGSHYCSHLRFSGYD